MQEEGDNFPLPAEDKQFVRQDSQRISPTILNKTSSFTLEKKKHTPYITVVNALPGAFNFEVPDVEELEIAQDTVEDSLRTNISGIYGVALNGREFEILLFLLAPTAPKQHARYLIFRFGRIYTICNTVEGALATDTNCVFSERCVLAMNFVDYLLSRIIGLSGLIFAVIASVKYWQDSPSQQQQQQQYVYPAAVIQPPQAFMVAPSVAANSSSQVYQQQQQYPIVQVPQYQLQ
ncbi:hypothetical protein BDA99DRAFT_542487 [Phascolomyces articulosus]|uniref:Uncharacterized protein n=1 Tax=Phascolomyces articulosus TaxID=60185 RepID=A0AAD5JQ63_9FUNG|nr:hypothetical protein BDA99DRAFT_542487 [Phascolomyces articulosus]